MGLPFASPPLCWLTEGGASAHTSPVGREGWDPVTRAATLSHWLEETETLCPVGAWTPMSASGDVVSPVS